MVMSNMKTKYMTRNDCYTAGRKITPKGIMVHSTATPGVMAADWFSRWNKSFKAGEINRQVCVHAFLDDKESWQYLPWDHRGWHAGGAANNTHIGFEICEPAGFTYSGSTMVGYDVVKNEAYFRKAWQNAVELCVLLCNEYGLTEKEIICHSEGHKMGIASNHADVMHWFPKHGESMDTFRAAVRRALTTNSSTIDILVGDIVEINATTARYYPDGPAIPSWVKDTYHKVTQASSFGKVVLKGGKSCVLLGQKVDKSTGRESVGIMTWVDKSILSPITKAPQGSTDTSKLYRVQVGAFSNIQNAEATLKKLKTAGFDGYIKYQ
jgi:N-acetylmuramoyl-L-alanine amidase